MVAMMEKAASLAQTIYSRYLVRSYHSIQNPMNPNVLISYLPFTLRWPMNHRGFSRHQNRRESVEIVRVFEGLGFNVDVVFFSKRSFLPRNNYRIVFGLEPNFEKYCIENPDSLKIYYATGSYQRYQNAAELGRIDDLNSRRGSNLKAVRLVREHRSAEIADWIFQIGSRYTVSTYPAELQEKVLPIGQSSFDFLASDLTKKNFEKARNRFLWFGGKGAVLKGLDLCLDVFHESSKGDLFIVGNIESDFIREFRDELYHEENIHYLGWLDVSSTRLKEVADSCGFVVLPSASEGMPGSIVSMMRLGLIPIVSKNASYEGFEKIGYILNEIDLENLRDAVRWAQSLSPQEIVDLARDSQEFARTHFTLDAFRNNFIRALSIARNSRK